MEVLQLALAAVRTTVLGVVEAIPHMGQAVLAVLPQE
jgi:hypothetical protein